MNYGKTQIGIVVEVYDHSPLHRIIVIRLTGVLRVHYFFLVSKSPQIDFGDKILMNFLEDKYYISRGNSRLTYKIIPLIFPGTLLFELITERMSL